MRTRFTLLIFTFFSILILGFLLSWDSLPDQEGYFEMSWNLVYHDFGKILMTGFVTPLNFFVVTLIHKLTSVSLSNSWKIMDLSAGGVLGAFLVWVFWRHQKPQKFIDLIKPIAIMVGSFCFVYPLTSMTGEGLAVCFAAVAIYFFSQKKYHLATPLFILSFLSKYTIYLITPGIILWVILKRNTLSADDKKNLIRSLVIFLTVFFTYHFIKNWADIRLQSAYNTQFNPLYLLSNLPFFMITLGLGTPLLLWFVFSNFSFSNLFILASFSALVMMLRRYFFWHYPVQIVPFLVLYAFTHKNALVFFSWRRIIVQLTLMIALIHLLPIQFGKTTIFPKKTTISTMKKVDLEIQKDYKGGKVGYYQNRRFDETWPHYEISYLDPSWDFEIQASEYVVIPTALGIPAQLTQFENCQYIFVKKVETQSIYRVKCDAL